MFSRIYPYHMHLASRPDDTNTDGESMHQDLVARSGHRIVVDNKYIYCWGGYNPEFWEVENTDDTAYPLFKELWRYQIWTGKWQLLTTHGEVPTQLASHTVIKVGNYLLHFGGTGVPFGMTNTNFLYILDLSTLEWKILYKPEDTNDVNKNIPRAKYGHSMTHVGRIVYVVGGTCGYTYDTDVHKFDLHTLTWEEIPAKSKYIPEPRYRQEVIYYKGKLLMFGGGAGVGHSAFRLSKIDVFDLTEQTWENVMTVPCTSSADTTEQGGYPGSRRCHSCVRYHDDVYVCGGLAPDGIQRDLWRFHLPTYQWTQLQVPFPKPVYFHSSAVNDDGCMFVFGGVTRIDDTRSNDLQIMWLTIPTLKLLTWNKVLSCLNVKLCKQSHQTLIDLGIPRQFIDLIL